MKKLLFILLVSIIPGSKKPNDCPRLSLKEQGDIINEFLHDYNQYENFKKSLKQNGYCLSQFGLGEKE